MRLWLIVAALALGTRYQETLWYNDPVFAVLTAVLVVFAGVVGYWSHVVQRRDLAEIDAQRAKLDELQRRLLGRE